jgi:plasmid stabilization system protein ParE
MMLAILHPLVDGDIDSIADHIFEATDGDFAAVDRRVTEIHTLLVSIAGNPRSGTRLSGRLDGWLVRHGGRGQAITVAFRPAPDLQAVYIALVAFGGQDWMMRLAPRRDFGRG